MKKETLEKYKLIMDEYFINKFNGAKAYKLFFPNVKQDSTAKSNFSRIKKIPEVQAYIKLKQEEAAKIIEVTQEGILKELKYWIESDITETIGLTPEQLKKLPVQLRRLINKYKHNTKSFYSDKGVLLSVEENIMLSFVSKERAYEMINKHIGFYEADNEQKKESINWDDLPDDILLKLWNAKKS
jgi:phage terminase small subunit